MPANVSYAGNTATINPNADLDPSAVYDVTVKGGHGSRTPREPARGGRHLELHHRAPQLHRHHHRRLQRRHPRRRHLRLRDRQRRGHPEADRGSGVLGQLAADRLGELSVERSGSRELHARDRRHGLWRQPARGRLLREDRRDLRIRPLARVQGHLQPAEQRARRIRGGHEQLAELGDLQRQVRRHLQCPHQQRRGHNRDAASDRPGRQLAPLPDRVGRNRGSLLRGRGAGRNARSGLRRNPDAPDRQRPDIRRA